MFEVIILFFHSLFGFYLLFNTRKDRLFITILSPLVWKILVTISIISLFFLIQIPFNFYFFKIILIYTPFLLIIAVKVWFIFHWQEQLITQLELLINNLIAQIKIGCAFRSGFKIALTHLNKKIFQSYFTEILDCILFSKQLRPELSFSPLQQIVKELKKADESSQCLEHLENLRHYLQTRTYFRNKVQSALFQVRMQSYILLVLYASLMVFVIYSYGLKYPKVLFVSFCCFTIGLIVLSQLGRRVKWTI